MIKQRNIFNPDKIDLLKDESPQQAPKRIQKEEERERQRQILEAYNRGLKINTSKRAGQISEAPLFGQTNAKQADLF